MRHLGFNQVRMSANDKKFNYQPKHLAVNGEMAGFYN